MSHADVQFNDFVSNPEIVKESLDTHGFAIIR